MGIVVLRLVKLKNEGPPLGGSILQHLWSEALGLG